MSISVDVNNLDPLGTTSGPARSLAGPVKTGAITFDVEYGSFARWVYIGTSGDLSYVKWDGTTEVLPNIASGLWHPIPSIKINSATTIPATQLRWGS